MSDYEAKRDTLAARIAAAGPDVRLGKRTTNLFRARDDTGAHKLDVRAFNQVIGVNPTEGWVDVEGMTPYAALVEATLPHGVMPAVVPELKSITIGGAISGTGLESSSFRYGFVHETVQEMDVLLADGTVVTCTPTNEHSDLFFGLPNSYGTLGYVLRAKIRAVPIKPYVHTRHIVNADPHAHFAAMREMCARPDVDFVEGVVFSENQHVITIGRFVDAAPYTSDYTFENIYYRSLLKRAEDYLTVKDYIWRWDTDWFWCSRVLFAQNPIVRRILGRHRLNSIFYMDVIHWNRRWHVTETLERLRGAVTEAVIQDVEIPIDRAAEFLEFFHREIGLRPIINGPVVGSTTAQGRFPLFPLKPDVLYVNIGFWDTVRTRKDRPPGYLNRRIEDKVAELGGLKMLYSESYYDEAEFRGLYNGPVYDRLKAKYDPEGRLSDLYRKCVLRQ